MKCIALVLTAALVIASRSSSSKRASAESETNRVVLPLPSIVGSESVEAILVDGFVAVRTESENNVQNNFVGVESAYELNKDDDEDYLFTDDEEKGEHE